MPNVSPSHTATRWGRATDVARGCATCADGVGQGGRGARGGWGIRPRRTYTYDTTRRFVWGWKLGHVRSFLRAVAQQRPSRGANMDRPIWASLFPPPIGGENSSSYGASHTFIGRPTLLRFNVNEPTADETDAHIRATKSQPDPRRVMTSCGSSTRAMGWREKSVVT